MAEKDITTWEEFKAAIVEVPEDETTYNIKNDLDATNDILTESIEMKGSVRPKKTFNGNGHKINGITTYTNKTIFIFNSETVLNNIQFTNIMAQSAKLFDTNTNLGRTFNDCFINGLFSSLTLQATTTTSFTFNRCSFNVKISHFSNFNDFTSCYIIVDLFEDVNRLGVSNTFENCFIGGVLKNTLINNTAIEHVGYTSQSTGKYPCTFKTANVFNCKVIVTNYDASFNYYGASRANNGTVLNNADKVFQADGVTKIPASQLKVHYDAQWLTDAQMKDKNYIQQNTQFPLYG